MTLRIKHCLACFGNCVQKAFSRHPHKTKSASSKAIVISCSTNLPLAVIGDLSEHFHGVGIGPLSEILAVKVCTCEITVFACNSV